MKRGKTRRSCSLTKRNKGISPGSSLSAGPSRGPGDHNSECIEEGELRWGGGQGDVYVSRENEPASFFPDPGPNPAAQIIRQQKRVEGGGEECRKQERPGAGGGGEELSVRRGRRPCNPTVREEATTRIIPASREEKWPGQRLEKRQAKKTGTGKAAAT